MSEQFVASVRAYIALIESLPQTNIRDFLAQCAELLPQIYSLGQSLSEVDISDDVLEDEAFADEVESPIKLIGGLVGKYNFYTEVFDPVYDKDTVMGSISDDLANIYLDLKRPMLKYEMNENSYQTIAIWEWKFNIEGHCGNHIVNVLRPIHWLVFSHLPSDA